MIAAGPDKIGATSWGKPTMWFTNRSDTNRPVQAQKQASSKLEISDLRRGESALSV